MNNHPDCLEARRRRFRNALWGLFAGDALAMPAHWIYTRATLPQVFPGGVRDYLDPPHPHPESFMFKMAYDPDVETASKMGRPFDILHRHARFFESNYDPPDFPPSGREYKDGRFFPDQEVRYHYHHGLQKGKNTQNAHLVRVLMRSIIRDGRYDPDRFIQDFIEHLTSPDKSADPYIEVALRSWFENYSRGLPHQACAESQRRVWSIGSHGGIIRPLVLSTLAGSAYQGLGLALEHQHLTHRSENVAASLGILVPLFHDLLNSSDPGPTVCNAASRMCLTYTSGKQLNRLYWEHNGPKNIPADEMWQLHTRLLNEPFDLDRLAREKSDEDIILLQMATSCYPEHGVPLLLYFAYRHKFDLKEALLANVNAGGDNVHRGMILGMILGAACDEIPPELQQGLADFEELQDEIEAFVELAFDGRAI